MAWTRVKLYPYLRWDLTSLSEVVKAAQSNCKGAVLDTSNRDFSMTGMIKGLFQYFSAFQASCLFPTGLLLHFCTSLWKNTWNPQTSLISQSSFFLPIVWCNDVDVTHRAADMMHRAPCCPGTQWPCALKSEINIDTLWAWHPLHKPGHVFMKY